MNLLNKYPPVLLAYAKARDIPFMVYAPPIGAADRKSTILGAWSDLIASWEPVPDFKFVPGYSTEREDLPFSQ